MRPAKNPKTGKPLFDDEGNALYVFNAGRGLPDGHWRDPQGLIRNGDGQVASGVHREQERS